jgi:hypothetical protein
MKVCLLTPVFFFSGSKREDGRIDLQQLELGAALWTRKDFTFDCGVGRNRSGTFWTFCGHL